MHTFIGVVVTIDIYIATCWLDSFSKISGVAKANLVPEPNDGSDLSGKARYKRSQPQLRLERIYLAWHVRGHAGTLVLDKHAHQDDV